MTDEQQKPFDKPTNEWIEEEVDLNVMSPIYNPETKRVELKEEKKKVKQRTYYSDSPASRVVCNSHHYQMLDPGKYMFKCTKCDWHRIAPPVTFQFIPETGELLRRKTGQRV